MKRFLILTAALLALICCVSCAGSSGNDIKKSDAFKMPDDFSFSYVWGTYGISSYDSATGKLVKTSDATDVGKYTAYVKLSKEDMQSIYETLFYIININRFPDTYDPFNEPDAENRLTSEPDQTVIITVTANGVTKTVKCEKIPFGTLTDCISNEARLFVTAMKSIEQKLTSLPEWQAFPDYEKYYE